MPPKIGTWFCVDGKDSTKGEVKKPEHASPGAKKLSFTDLDLVMEHGHVGREEAIRALELTKGDIVEAIMNCMSK